MLCKLICKNSASNFFLKVLFVNDKFTYLCRPEKIEISEGIGLVVQLVRMLPCHGRGRGFESRPARTVKES